MFSLLIIYFCVMNSTIYAQSNEKTYLHFELDEQPQFGQSKNDLTEYIYRNLKWPKGSDGTGEVIVSFIVTKIGKVEKVKLIKSLGSLFDEAALKVFQDMPNWQPGKLDNEYVNVRLFFPVKFILN